ncbi:probable transcriptional regulator [Oceanicola granulosus HTCC2516]|uniref:Probable transcriptional regulator n=1 Tax=Oceanicola granulosus (strain ATCC BAA-861 / DSM 15982 / KCTC 12143 / HTCC2516) TaxID=314256 RepID=Q2CJE8_OCEGH|nr:IclR family transcriptional regulator C-terminal domain-containing protein [Oceanicola granulosus]EAR52652.1 probable transcriptional regulator [Oceanicola granulosus HTCC2516]
MRNDQADDVDNRLFLKSVARALHVLEAFGRHPHPLSLREIAEAAGIDKSAAQRVAQTLLTLGYLERAGNDAGLLPGKALLDRSFDYLRTNPLIERAAPVLSQLRATARERVDLSLFDGTTIIYAMRLQSKRETFYATLAGRRIPTFSSSGGRACLARLDEAEARDIVERCDRQAQTQKTITDVDAVMDKVREARADGYACALEESLIGEIVLSAAVTDLAGRPLGAIHIAGSLAEWDEDDFRRRFAPHAIAAAKAL